MTDQEINIAIAEACAWTNIQKRTQEHVDFDSRAITHITGVSGYPNGWDTLNYLPDCCNDLDVMHEAESWLKNDDLHVFSCYASDLFDEHGIDAIHLSAYQRAKSFLRYINLHKQ